MRDCTVLGRVPCLCTSCLEPAHALPNTKPYLNSIASMHNNTTTITPIDEAVADLKLQESGEQYTLKEISEKHSIDHLMLERQ
jgi:hypothetical protein